MSEVMVTGSLESGISIRATRAMHFGNHGVGQSILLTPSQAREMLRQILALVEAERVAKQPS